MNKKKILDIVTVGGSAILIVGAVSNALQSKSAKDIALSVVAVIVGVAAFTSVTEKKKSEIKE